MQNVSSLGKKRSFGTSLIQTRQVVILLEIKCKSDLERSEQGAGPALGSGQAHGVRGEGDGFALCNPTEHCEPSLGSALPLAGHDACSQWFSLVCSP